MQASLPRSRGLVRKLLVLALSIILPIILLAPAVYGEQRFPVLKREDKGAAVQQVQVALASLGLYKSTIDGVYGRETELAVRIFQSNLALHIDGVVGQRTWEALHPFLTGTEEQVPVSRGLQVIPWAQAHILFRVGQTAKVTDVQTGEFFGVKRLGGHLHADVEPASRNDTDLLKKIYGGRWSWTRRAIVVEINGMRIAASMNGYPHGSHRINNGFPGHFCIHFYGSKLHKTRREDPDHQRMVLAAAGLTLF